MGTQKNASSYKQQWRVIRKDTVSVNQLAYDWEQKKIEQNGT